MRDEVSGGWVFARARDCQFPLGLQQFQGIACPARAFFFDNGQYLVLEIGLAHVKETLPGHSRVFHPLLNRYQRQHRVHERGFASGT